LYIWTIYKENIEIKIDKKKFNFINIDKLNIQMNKRDGIISNDNYSTYYNLDNIYKETNWTSVGVRNIQFWSKSFIINFPISFLFYFRDKKEDNNYYIPSECHSRY